jgi:adenosylcobinamide kinase/adenosylcobinamide-phosphate guanylyltransferase
VDHQRRHGRAVIALVLGGARSGKSAFAERLVNRLPAPVTYVATAEVSDPDMAARVAVHRARRPLEWRTLEDIADLPAAVGALSGTVLIDSLGTWTAGAVDFQPDIEALCEVLRRRQGDTVIVSEEVGFGVHPSSELGRRFRDALGTINQAVAAFADDVVLIVAGRPLHLGPPES